MTKADIKTVSENKEGEVKNSLRRIAVPVAEGKVATHFGHCEEFVFFDVNPDTREIMNTSKEVAPPHQPGLLPTWLEERDVEAILASGIGRRAINLFEEKNIEVLTGAPAIPASEAVQKYLEGLMTPGENACNH